MERNLNKYLIFLPIVYIFIYNPVFRILHVSFLKPLLLLAFLYLYLKHRGSICFTLILKESMYFFFLFLLTFIMGGVVGNGNFTMSYKHIQAFLETYVLAFVLSDYIKYYKIDIHKLLAIVGSVASAISIYLLLHPMQSVYLRTNVITDSLVDIGYDAKMHMFRSFGIAEGLTSFYGAVQGFIAGVCLLNVKKSFLYLLPVPFIVLSAFINARTGVLIFLISVPFFLYDMRKSKGIIIVIPTLIILCFIVFILLQNEKYAKTFEWGFSMFDDIKKLMSGDKSGNFTSLFGDMLFFPTKSAEFLLGTGHMARNTFGKSSDISFVNRIFFGGITYMLLITMFCFYVSLIAQKTSNSIGFSVLVLGCLLLMDFKGMDPSLPNGVVRVIYLIIFSLNNNIRERKYEKRTSYFFRYTLS